MYLVPISKAHWVPPAGLAHIERRIQGLIRFVIGGEPGSRTRGWVICCHFRWFSLSCTLYRVYDRQQQTIDKCRGWWVDSMKNTTRRDCRCCRYSSQSQVEMRTGLTLTGIVVPWMHLWNEKKKKGWERDQNGIMLALMEGKKRKVSEL